MTPIIGDKKHRSSERSFYHFTSVDVLQVRTLFTVCRRRTGGSRGAMDCSCQLEHQTVVPTSKSLMIVMPYQACQYQIPFILLIAMRPLPWFGPVLVGLCTVSSGRSFVGGRHHYGVGSLYTPDDRDGYSIVGVLGLELCVYFLATITARQLTRL